MESNGGIDTIASSSCMTEKENEEEHNITGISNDVLNNYYDKATDDNTISDEQLKRIFDRDDVGDHF